jgi:chromosome partitioning protein
MILALINNKGGVAKTTSAVNLAAALAEKDKRVLLIDADSQGAASLSLGVPRAELTPSLAIALTDHKPIREIIRKTKVEGLDLITSANDLAGIDMALAGADQKESRLSRALEPVLGEYAHVVIDCPPSLSLMSVNALNAAEFYLVPVVPQFLTLGGLASLVEEVNRICGKNTGEIAALMGFLLTMVDYRNRTTVALVESMRSGWKDNVLKTEIRVNVKLSEAPSLGKTIFEHAPGSSGAKTYRELAKEVSERYEAMTTTESGN